jgi:hypothetical protein
MQRSTRVGGLDRRPHQTVAVGRECAVAYRNGEPLLNDKLISKMKRGAYLVNTARAKICDRDAIVRALESGQLAGYAGDVWFPQPAPKDHPWRTMAHHGMTPHISGTSLSARARYAAGTREILECFFERRPIPRRISDRRWRQACRSWRALLYRRRRNWRIRRGGKIQKPPTTICVTRRRLRNRTSLGLAAA